MNRKIMPLILMLVAGIVTCVILFVENYPMFDRLLVLLIVLVVFYLLGNILKWALDYFEKQNTPPEIESQEGEAIEENGEGEQGEEGEVIEKDTEVESEEQQETVSEE
ncbi:MAG: hypothetical protein NC417_03385 [Candidatus Gastranaerophilales bacterium]|nr:hypothetical protein [Candidatus Gastranaerophilales bacterium]